MSAENVGRRFDRLPATAADRDVAGRATRREVLDFWDDRFGVPPATFDGYSLWEKGKGKVWILHGDLASPVEIEALGMLFVRTRQRYWKPTTNAVQRFGARATRNVVGLGPDRAARFAAGEDQPLSGDALPGSVEEGYVVVTHDLAGGPEPVGVGLYLGGELRSLVPKGRRRERRPGDED